MDTSANSPEPTNDPTPEKKKNKPIMALCMDLGAAEYANSRPAILANISLMPISTYCGTCHHIGRSAAK